MDGRRAPEAPARDLRRWSALQGLLAWIVYWLIESFLLHILPWLREPGYHYMPPHAVLTAMLVGVYALGGLITGAAAGKIAAWWTARRPHDRDAKAVAAVLITLFLSVLVLVSVLMSLPRELPLWYAVTVFLPVGFSLVISLHSRVWQRRLAFITNPWTATVFLLAPPFIFDGSDGGLSLSDGTLSFLLYAGAAILISFLIPLPSTRARSIFPIAAVSTLLLAACFPLHQTPHISPLRTSAMLPANTPNVILITLDTVRADHLSLYGYERDTTPNLNRLAREATVFTNAVSTGNMTLSSHASMFTGLYPSWHHAHLDEEHARPLDPKCPTLAEMLAGKGFDTVGIVSNYTFLAHGFGLDRGFAYHDAAAPVQILGGRRRFLLRDRIRRFLALFCEPWQTGESYRNAEDINNAAFAALDRETHGTKFFLFLNYMDAHEPYIPPGRFATMYPGRDRHIKYSTEEKKEVMNQQRPLSDRERRNLISQYDGGIAYMDWCLGKLFDRLKQLGLYDNTLLIVTSDHGEAFGERSLLGHALAVYQDEIHVPLIIKYPRVTTKEVIGEPVSLVDLMPTVLDTLAYQVPKGIQGESLLRRIPGEARDLISEGFIGFGSTKLSPRFHGTEQAIFSGPMKFIQSSTGSKELYDISQDPNELHNLLPVVSGAVLEGKLAEYLNLARKQQPQNGSKSRQNLRSLGYLQ